MSKCRVTVPPKSCPSCEGDGRRWNKRWQRFEDAICRVCNGTGYDPRDPFTVAFRMRARKLVKHG